MRHKIAIETLSIMLKDRETTTRVMRADVQLEHLQEQDQQQLMQKKLESAITAIRNNVSRVLSMYFQNVSNSDDYDYGQTLNTSTTTIYPINTIKIDRATMASKLLTQNAGNGLAFGNQTTASVTIRSIINTIANADTETETTAIIRTIKIPLETTTTTEATIATATGTTPMPSIIYPSYKMEIRNYENCSTLFSNYTKPYTGTFCNWAWDKFLCWPPTPAGALAHMRCPSGWHGIDTRKFAKRKCELNGQWGSRPNETINPNGWTDYRPCFKPEVNELMQQLPNLELFLDIARRTRTMEIVGLIISLIALIISLIIFCNFRSLRNNRTKIHKNLFIAMVLQVIVRLCLYLDQAFYRDNQQASNNTNIKGIENTPYLCEASYVLLEYARTAMFMWMFIEGWYLHNVVTGTVFQGRFPHKIFTIVGWGMPIIMTTIWAICTAIYHDSVHDCWWNYNLTPYYWILEGPRLIVILLNFTFLINIIRVLVVKLRESQASDIEQARKAVRAAIVLLPLLGITNLLQLIPDLHTPWKFALWSYVTHFLTSFQGFFIAMIYCFLNGEVRAVLLKNLAVYMSVRGHSDWAAKKSSMYSAAYNTAPDTEAQASHLDIKRNESPSRHKRSNSRKASNTIIIQEQQQQEPSHHITSRARLTSRLANSMSSRSFRRQRQGSLESVSITPQNGCHPYHKNHSQGASNGHNNASNNNNWMFSICFRSHKVHRVPPASTDPPESVVFELSEQ